MDPLERASYGLIPTADFDKHKGLNKGEGFLGTLKTYIYQVDTQIKKADQITEEFAVGKRYDLHEIMIATEKADLSFKLLLKIRNKLIEAYQEVMRMQF